MDVDGILRHAIDDRRLIDFLLHGLRRVAQPHTYGNFDGVEHLLVYQVGGESRSGKLPDWRRFKVSDMRDVRMLDEHFSPPPIATSRHMRWDVVFVRVEQESGRRSGADVRRARPRVR